MPEPPATPAHPSEGRFVLEGIGPGDYRVIVSSLPANTFVQAVRMAGENVLDGSLQIETPPEAELEIIINPNGGGVEGVIRNERFEPVANATVVLVPEAAYRSRTHLYRVASSDLSGRFELSGIMPGSYKVFAWESVQSNVWLNPDFMRLFENMGTPIRVEEATRVEVQVTLVHNR